MLEFLNLLSNYDVLILVVGGELIATHERCWGLHQWIMDINHYLKTFERKKGAIAQSECLRQAPTKIKNIYYEHYMNQFHNSWF